MVVGRESWIIMKGRILKGVLANLDLHDLVKGSLPSNRRGSPDLQDSLDAKVMHFPQSFCNMGVSGNFLNF